MPTRSLTAAALLAAALLAGTAGTALAQSAPTGAAAPKAKAPAAAPAKRDPARFSVKDGSCKQFLALPADLRGLVVAWAAGRYHRLDRWVLDEDTARKVIAGVEQECEKTPDASFRYKVVGEVEKLR